MTPANSCEEVYSSLINEGVHLFTKGDYSAAQEFFWQAFRLRPEAPIVLFNIGRTMEEFKDPRAIDFYEAAVEKGSVNASYNLATIYVESPHYDKDAAIQHLKLYLKKTTDADADAGTDQGARWLLWAQQMLNYLEPPKQGLKLVWSKGKVAA